ncbi:MAG: DUF4956 domain-containing protein [Lachnospiraceae bacterium]
MKEFILDNFSNMGNATFSGALLNNVVAVLLGLFIMFTYWATYSGTAYSKKFNVSLGMLLIITTLIMNVISSNIALSLGMVGALSIIRFRTAVKDVRDATFIFWCIAAGIACGISKYMPALIGSVTIFVFLMIFRQVGSEDKYIIIIKGTVESLRSIEGVMGAYYSGRAHLRAKNVIEDRVDLVYEVSARTLVRGAKRANQPIEDELFHIEGVTSVNQVIQSDDMSR